MIIRLSFGEFTGEKYQYDPDFKGPKSRRSPTDVYWLVAFLVFTAIWLSFGISGKYSILLLFLFILHFANYQQSHSTFGISASWNEIASSFLY